MPKTEPPCLMTPAERQRLIEETVTQDRRLLERRLEEDPQTLDEIEQVVEEIGQEMDRTLEQENPGNGRR